MPGESLTPSRSASYDDSGFCPAAGLGIAVSGVDRLCEEPEEYV